MDYLNTKDRLRKYFSKITYIDDKFDVGLVSKKDFEGENEEVVPVDFGQTLEQETLFSAVEEIVLEDDEEDVGYKQLGELIKILNENEYQEIDLNPVLYDEEMSDERIIAKMERSNLTIIDWDLGQGSGKKALPIIKTMLDRTQKLKVIVVYTNGYSEAVKSVDDIFEEPKKITQDEKVFGFKCRCNSLVFIVNRQSVDLLQILELVEKSFIEENGIMPIAMLDLSEKMQEKSDELFGNFVSPIEDAYFLQMYYSEVPESEWTKYFSNIIMQKCKNDIKVDIQIINEMLKMKKDNLLQIIKEDKFTSQFKCCLEVLEDKIRHKFGKVIEAIKEYDSFEPSLYEESIKGAEDWSAVLKCFAPLFNQIKKSMKKKEVEQFWERRDGEKIRISDADVQWLNKKIGKFNNEKIGNLVVEFQEDIFPIIIQMIISDISMIEKFSDLVHNLKYDDYITTLSETLMDGKVKSVENRTEFLMDKIRFGDILHKDGGNEYLLCITPPCDTFRPEKTELNYVFITGVEAEQKDMRKRKKTSMHISTYPNKNSDGITTTKYIKWRFYDIQRFDLKLDEDYEKIISYNRCYKLEENYTRQIANEFIAYFSRAGVEEIFFKQKINLLGMF